MRAPANGIELEYETFGDRQDPPLVLVMGLGAQMIWIHEDFCEGLVDRGFFVVRFDNRDVGRSTWFPAHPDVGGAALALLAGEHVEVPYTLADMADDTWGLCDHLGIERPHLLGISLGGMVVQQMAIDRPERVAGLTSIMSTTGDPDVGQPRPDALDALLEPPPSDRAGYIAHTTERGELLAGPEHTDDGWIAARNALAFDRGVNPGASGNQLLALLASPSRSEGLRGIEVPAAVLHGDLDPLVDISGGRRTAECLRGSEFVPLEGMGHDLPRYYWASVIHQVVTLASRAAG